MPIIDLATLTAYCLTRGINCTPCTTKYGAEKKEQYVNCCCAVPAEPMDADTTGTFRHPDYKGD